MSDPVKADLEKVAFMAGVMWAANQFDGRAPFIFDDMVKAAEGESEELRKERAAPAENCRTCNGRGRVPRRSDRPFPGGVTDMKSCPDCNRAAEVTDDA